MEDREIAKILDITWPTLKKRIKQLTEKNIIAQIKKRPSVHILLEQFIDSMEGY